MSLCNSQGSEERSLVLHLKLTTFAGEEIQLAIDLQEYDRLNEFEDAVLNQLPCLGGSSAFGCELQFVHKDTHEVLVDPIWNTLRDNNCFNVIVRQCFVDAEHKGHLKGGAKAIRVPSGTTDRILPQAFSFHTEVRHVQVEAGIRIASDCRWSTCGTQSSAYSMERFADVTCSVQRRPRDAGNSEPRSLKPAAL